MLYFDHHETLRRDGGAGFGAVPQFVQAIDVGRRELSAPHVEHRAHHLTHHITKERAPANGKDQLFVVRAARQLGREDFALENECRAFDVFCGFRLFNCTLDVRVLYPQILLVFLDEFCIVLSKFFDGGV